MYVPEMLDIVVFRDNDVVTVNIYLPAGMLAVTDVVEI